MSSLGSLEEATKVVNFTSEALEAEGWKRFNSNCSRVVWLSPTGVVYKRDSWDQQNDKELKAQKRLKRRGFKKWYIPKTTSYQVKTETIVAMEYIPGDTVKIHYGLDKIRDWDERDRKEREIYDRDKVEVQMKVRDLHSDNLIQMANGKIAIVDFGFSRSNW